VTPACLHGFPPDDCLICRTLAGGGSGPADEPAPARRGRRERTAAAPRRPDPASADPALGIAADPPTARPDAVYPPGSTPGRGRAPRNPSAHLMAVILGLVVIALLAWMVAGVVFAVFHVIELALVAVAAGWAGYRLGYFRGSRARR
jgi:hypothetical protein